LVARYLHSLQGNPILDLGVSFGSSWNSLSMFSAHKLQETILKVYVLYYIINKHYPSSYILCLSACSVVCVNKCVAIYF